MQWQILLFKEPEFQSLFPIYERKKANLIKVNKKYVVSVISIIVWNAEAQISTYQFHRALALIVSRPCKIFVYALI